MPNPKDHDATNEPRQRDRINQGSEGKKLREKADDKTPGRDASERADQEPLAPHGGAKPGDERVADSLKKSDQNRAGGEGARKGGKQQLEQAGSKIKSKARDDHSLDH